MKFRFDRTTTDTAKAVFVCGNPWKTSEGTVYPRKITRNIGFAKFCFKAGKTDATEKFV